MTTLAESFDYQGATGLPMGRPDEKQALAGSGGGNIELARVIPDESIDLIFTDPPYLKANIEDGIYA